jgi:hypothetical protein
MRRPGAQSGKAKAPREETSECTLEAAGVGVRAREDRLAEITSGRAIAQQGLAATCNDRKQEGNQRRTEGNGLTHEPAGAMKEGQSPWGQRGSGHLAVPGWLPDLEPGQADPRSRDEFVCKLSAGGVHVCQHLNIAALGKAHR